MPEHGDEREGPAAAVNLDGWGWTVRVGEKELARFGAEKTNAQDFANGYNAAQAEVTRLRGVLEQIADIPGTLHRDMCSKKARAALADKQPEPPPVCGHEWREDIPHGPTAIRHCTLPDGHSGAHLNQGAW